MRVILIVLDSFGVGALPDANKYGDSSSNTFRSVATLNPNLKNMQAMGLYNLLNSSSIPQKDNIGAWGKCAEKSAGKDTTTGHLEIAGHILKEPFSTYPNGFPQEVISPFEKAIGIGILGNEAASGTEIINRLGAEHMRTGKPIVYTSADSVFQIAAHESVISVPKLYDMCEKARALLVSPHMVGRVIARPFIGEPMNFTRTGNRKDFALPPQGDTMLDLLKAAGYQTVGVGKIEDIFAHRGLTKSNHTTTNEAGIEMLLKFMHSMAEADGLIFVNLVDFDMLYGHRRDVVGYSKALEYFDFRLGEIIRVMSEGDLLIITADHGCDPCYAGTDHTREYVPVLAYGSKVKPVPIGTRHSFSDISATVLDYFNIPTKLAGESFLPMIM